MSAPTYKEKFELPDGYYSVLDINSYFQWIMAKKY